MMDGYEVARRVRQLPHAHDLTALERALLRRAPGA
jgi:hypothetical protein